MAWRTVTRLTPSRVTSARSEGMASPEASSVSISCSRMPRTWARLVGATEAGRPRCSANVADLRSCTTDLLVATNHQPWWFGPVRTSMRLPTGGFTSRSPGRGPGVSLRSWGRSGARFGGPASRPVVHRDRGGRARVEGARGAVLGDREEPVAGRVQLIGQTRALRTEHEAARPRQRHGLQWLRPGQVVHAHEAQPVRTHRSDQAV